MIRTQAPVSIGMVSLGIVLAGTLFCPAITLAAEDSPSAAAAAHQTTLQMYCVGCHSGPTPFAGL